MNLRFTSNRLPKKQFLPKKPDSVPTETSNQAFLAYTVAAVSHKLFRSLACEADSLKYFAMGICFVRYLDEGAETSLCEVR
jgi:hypothetical protein